jgi:hypothetical protein
LAGINGRLPVLTLIAGAKFGNKISIRNSANLQGIQLDVGLGLQMHVHFFKSSVIRQITLRGGMALR